MNKIKIKMKRSEHSQQQSMDSESSAKKAGEKVKNKLRRILRKIIEIVPYRPNTESKTVYVIKLMFMCGLYAVCLCYIVLLAFDIKNENPHLETYKDLLPRIPAPYLHFSAPFDFTLRCNFVGSDTQIANVNTPCQNYFNDPNNLTAIKPTNRASWNPAKLSVDSNVQLGPDGIFGLTVEVFRSRNSNTTLKNQTNSIWNTNMWFKINDSEFYKANFSQEDPDSIDAIEETFKLENVHFVSPGQKHIVRFKRLQNKDLNKHRVRNRAGIFTKTNDYFVLSSYMEVVSPENTTNLDPYATIEFYYQTRVIIVNEEIKDKTVIGLLSSLGGAFSLGVAIYAFCFGASQISPFGWAQELPFIRGQMKRRLRETFHKIEVLPLIDKIEIDELKEIESKLKSGTFTSTINDDDDIQPASISVDFINKLINHINLLERRSLATEILFRDFVVDVGDFKDLVVINRQQQEGLQQQHQQTEVNTV
ncbi:12863_t:CDS:2 [Ambispora gerdemannii]|uniref:12863_t:CDS:1 n=1 Tax=Ambispora gerdemannii TaxID=144530 RepID=A0A9N9CYJ8_9GLOM|nr:12863_t:CDS:2 [Ambispora gerdemannii]